MTDGVCEFALQICDQGIAKVLHDPGHRLNPPPAALTDLIDASSAEKCQTFLQSIELEGAAHAWELLVDLGEELRILSFSGCGFPGGKILFATAHSNQLSTLIDALIAASPNDADTRQLRRRIRPLSVFQARVATRQQHAIAPFEELMQLNNELTTVQRELSRRNRELMRLQEEKNLLLGMAAHDLRNPLSNIVMATELINRDFEETGHLVQRDLLAIVQNSSEHMLKLIESLLDFSAIESGQVRLDLQDFDLIGLINDCVAWQRMTAQTKQIAIHLVTPEQLDVHGDAEKLRQVINNLVGNAIKFSQPGLPIEVRLEVDDQDFVLSVADQGPGISPDELKLLFKPFSRVSTSPTAGETSTGLGLAIVKRIIEAQGGAIEVDSELGKGTQFHVRLPRRCQFEARTTAA